MEALTAIFFKPPSPLTTLLTLYLCSDTIYQTSINQYVLSQMTDLFQ